MRELFSRFEKRRGTTSCKELLGADISTDEGLNKIKQEQLVKKICCGDGGIGQDIAEILEELIGMPHYIDTFVTLGTLNVSNNIKKGHSGERKVKHGIVPRSFGTEGQRG